MIRAAIAEDDAATREQLSGFLQRYARESGEPIQVSLFTDGDELVENYRAEWDILLLDIEMPLMDGMTAAEHIRRVDTEVVIVFITNMPQYVMKGYKVDALDYVLKPVSYYALTQRMERALRRMRRRTQHYMMVPIRGGVRKVETGRVTYIEVMDHDLVYHTLDGDILSKGALGELESELEAERFFRCSKCMLVNLAYVDSLVGNDILVQGHQVQVSRARKKPLMDALNNYINEVST